MRIVFITHYAAMLGANRSLLHLLKALRDQYNVEALILSPAAGDFTRVATQSGFSVEIYPILNAAYTIRSKNLYQYWFKRRKYVQKTLPEIEARVRSFSPDIIHSNASVLNLGWQLSERLQTPHIWHIREFGWLDYQLIFPEGKKRIESKMANAASLIAISQTIAKSWNTGPNTAVLYNGVGPMAELTKRYQPKAPSAVFRCLLIGLLQPSKGQHQAIWAMHRLKRTNPEIQITIAGNGRKLYTLWVKILCKLLGLGNTVHFTGFVKEPESLYQSANALLMTSKMEAMGRVSAEAMSYGLPVIAYNGGANPELITDGYNGFLYHSTQELGEKMIELKNLNQETYLKMQQNAHGFALKNFNDEAYASGFWTVVTTVIRQANKH